MSIALGEFWKGLVKSGVADASGCKQIAGDYADANAGTPPSDSSELASFLVNSGILTDFQADALLADPPREIRSGNFVVRAQVGPEPVRRWIPVSRVDDGRVGVLFRVAVEQFIGGRDLWLQAHQEVEAVQLQAFDDETQQAWTLIFSELPEGQALSSFLDEGGSFSHRQVCELGISLASALTAMHERPLVHGAVRAEQVWLGKDGKAMLLRDPSGPPAGIDESQSGWFDGSEEVGLYAAPEFGHPDQECSAATDIYALGCLLFRLASGRFPVEGKSTAQLIKAHASVTPPELAEAVKKGESGDPLYRVLAFAMAKTPVSRFAAVEQLAHALTTILPLASNEVPMQEVAGIAQTTESPPGKESQSAGAGDSTAAESETPVIKDVPVVEVAQETRTKSASVTGAVQSRVAEIRVNEKQNAGKSDSSDPKVAEPSSSAQQVASTSKESTSKESTSKETVEPVKPEVAEQISAKPPSPPPVASEATARGLRARRKKKSKAPFVLGAMCVAILLLMIGLLVPRSPEEETADKDRRRPPVPDVIPKVTNGKKKKNDESPPPRKALEKVSETTGYQLIDDDRLLYVPPYPADTEKPLLEYLPPGPAIVASLRVASILESGIGDQVIDAFSPELEVLLSGIAERAKLPMDAIQTCGLALYAGKEGWPEVSLSIQLKTAVPAKDLIEKWGVAASRTADGVTIYAGDALESDAYYFEGKGEEPVSHFAIGSVAKISEVAEAEGGGILLPRNSQSLWNATSGEADIVVLLASPNFLFADGREMLSKSLPRFVDPLKSALQPDVSALVVTVDFGAEQMFVETRMAPSGGTSAAAIVRMLQEKINSWTDWADDFIVNSVPDASWRLLANRLRSMVSFVAQRVRFGVSDEMAVANVYLPAQAVPQVVLATVFALNTPEGAAVATGAPTAANVLSVDDMLDRKMSVTFEQESLEFAVDNIVTAFERDLPSGSKMPEIRIIGGDLQLMGITQNQQVRDFKQANVALRKVLTELVRRANPDKTATGANDEKQALIWVVTEDAETPGVKKILITTRNSAAGKYELPEEFKTE
jgi:serine/threonine protein kinase